MSNSIAGGWTPDKTPVGTDDDLISNAALVSICDTPPDVPDDLTFKSQFGETPELKVKTRNIWAVWWYPQFDHNADAEWLLDELDDVRCRAINDLGMQDPPNPGRGYFYNVYIHHGEEDGFPNGWGNGQGTDQFGNPFLTLPNGAHLDAGNIRHEGFHVFQYNGNSPGYAYAGDSQWYIESTAQWYAVFRDATAEDAFVEAGAIDGNPHLALWHSFSNAAPGDPKDWMFEVRQYGMHTYLYYLTEFAGVDRDIITRGFYAGTSKLPQEYHYDNVGGDLLRKYFADWAAHNTADFDYLLPAQVARARLEVGWVGDPDNIHPYVAEYFDEGTGGNWKRPPADLTARGWSYNVVRINNSSAADYKFYLRGDETGSENAMSHFEGRIVVVSAEGAEYADLNMADALEGAASVSVNPASTEVYFVIASVPEHFTGNQTYSYEYLIERNSDGIVDTTVLLNVVLPENGGVLESFTSEYGGGFDAMDLTNGITVEHGWASEINPGPQEFVYSFLDGMNATLNEAVIHAGTAEGTYFSKDVEVWTSADGNNYTKAASGTLQNTSNNSITLNLAETAAQKIKLIITSGYRDDYWELGEFEVYGAVGVTPIEEYENLPDKFYLSQNYPNPFNPSTTIKYSIAAVETGHAPSLQNVTLTVCDLLGKEIAVLVNEEKRPGEYQIMFDASNLSSGIYLLQMQAGDYLQLRKMMLIK